LTKQNRWG